jgi:spore coat protein SA
MKIALVCTEKLPVPPVSGGAIQIYMDGIIPYLARRHDITVFCVEHPSLPPEETVGNVKYIRLAVKNKACYVKKVKERLTEKYDLIQVFNRPQWISQLSENKPDTKFSLSLHNDMFGPDKISPAEAAACIDRVEFINTVSRYVANGIQSLYPAAESKLNVVYSGVDVDKFKPVWTQESGVVRKALKEKYKIENHKVVLFVGRLSVKKGVHVLLKAMQQVMDTRSDVALVIIGSKWFGDNTIDEYTRHLQELSASLKGPIIFTGFLTPPEIPDHYALGDVFVCPSQWNEPLARVHYEAMAAGLPIITTNRGGNAEVVTTLENGLVVDDYKSPEVFAQYIQFMLDFPERALDMGVAGRRLSEEKYTWARVAEDVLRPMEQTNIAR